MEWIELLHIEAFHVELHEPRICCYINYHDSNSQTQLQQSPETCHNTTCFIKLSSYSIELWALPFASAGYIPSRKHVHYLPHLKYIDIEPKTQQFNRCRHTRTLANRTIIYISRLKMGYQRLTQPHYRQFS